MKQIPHIASRVLNTPLLLEPGYARVFFSALAGRLNISELQDVEGQVSTGQKLRMNAESFEPARERVRPFEVVNGAAIIPVSGSLVHKYGYLKPYSGMTGYDGIVARVTEALGDPDVNGILLDLDTPGGEVAGCFDAVARLRQLADQAGKPLWSLCYDMACSGGMALASAGSRRLITQTGINGSVGVVMAHASYEDFLKQEGIKVTLIHSGAHKVEGNPYEDLPDDVLATFQASTDALRLQFATIVAQNLGLSVEQVLATEAACLRGEEAIEIGFADQMVNGHEAVAEFTEYLSGQGRVLTSGASMPPSDTTTGITADTLTPAADTVQPAPAAGGGQPTPAASERERISGILQHAEAKGREGLAQHLAFNTSVGVEEAVATLKAAAQSGGDRLDSSTALDRLMASEGQPAAGAAGEFAEPSEAEQIVAAHNKATGSKRA
ncbi:Clp protease ClpP [Pseudomonas sp. 21]|uniref:S49 family peptidase n=1 Tax=Pseudomonas sp. 21 TaxID=1619948 RepID=UPI0005EB16C4|nr:S49 family peptidase [Pseudomonas sp. 21]KJK03574.1 Clp protease ClpP [Pseudomonas sp. 21]